MINCCYFQVLHTATGSSARTRHSPRSDQRREKLSSRIKVHHLNTVTFTLHLLQFHSQSFNVQLHTVHNTLLSRVSPSLQRWRAIAPSSCERRDQFPCANAAPRITFQLTRALCVVAVSSSQTSANATSTRTFVTSRATSPA